MARRRRPKERGWDHLEDDAVLLEERCFDHLAGELETEHIPAAADGPHRTVTFRLRVYTATKLARLIDDVGFGDLGGGKLSRESRLVVRARKPATGRPSPPTATASRSACESAPMTGGVARD
jgi:hypothetical protein